MLEPPANPVRFTNPYYIALANPTLVQLRRKHPTLEKFWREEFGYGIETLTEGEAGHLRSAPSADTIGNRLAEARRDLYGDRDEGADSTMQATSNQSDDQVDE
jgi:hypothetical protein